MKATRASFIAYNKKGGARSNKKLIPIHKFLSETILKKLKNGYSIKSLGTINGKEATADGKYYPKDLDIAIFKKDKIVMKKIPKWIKIAALITAGAVAGAVIFSFVAAKTLWFPNITTTQDGKTGVEMYAYSYSPWLWNQERITKIVIFDRKNDGPRFEIKLNGLIDGLRLVHSGEDFAVIAVRASEWASDDRIYILHRVPKADGKESLEYKDIPGKIFAVAPDEKSYFYAYPSQHSTAIIRRDWEDNDLAKIDIPKGYESPAEDPVFFTESPLFFSNQNKLAINIIKLDDYRHTVDDSLIIWDLSDNTTSTILIIKLFPNYSGGKLQVEQDGKLYIEKSDTKIQKVKITE